MKKLKTFLKQVAPLVEAYGNKSILADIESAIDRTEQSTSVLFCGEFKRGKSSLVNAIVGDNLCPTDIGIATSVITTIKYGAVKKAIRYYGNILENPDSLKSEEIEWSDIKKYTMGDVLDIDNTILVELSYPSPFLKNGITIIDTPGIGGLDPRHAVLTHTALPKADVIVFVTDAGEPLTQSELDFYENKVLLSGKPNIVLVNKADILTDETLTAHIDNTKLRLAKFGTSNVTPVSAKYWNRYIIKQDEKSLLRSNKDAVLAGITLEIEASKKQQCKQYRDMVVATLQTASSTISLEVEQLKKDSTDKQTAIEELQEKQITLIQYRNDLKDPTSQIRLEISSIFENARNEVQNLISHDGTLLTSTRFDTLLDHEHALENEGKWFVARVNDNIRQLSLDMDHKIENAFDEISTKLGREVSNNMENKESTFVLSNQLVQREKNTMRLISSIIGKCMQGSVLGGLAGGGLIAFGATTPIAPIVGLATVAAFVWKGMKIESIADKKIFLKQQILPKVQLIIQDMRNHANTRFSEFHQQLLLSLHKITEETESKMKELQVSIQESRISDQKCKEKIADLEKKIKYCETTIAQMNLLYTNPFSHA